MVTLDKRYSCFIAIALENHGKPFGIPHIH